MGNYVSCTLASPLMKNSNGIRVIIPSGELKHFRNISKVAELMLQHPNFFLVNSRSLHIGRRFSALSADQDLDFGNLYVFFPMRRLNSVVTAADMTVLFFTANTAAKRLSGRKVQVQPHNDASGACQQEKEQSSEDESRTEIIPRLSLEGVDSGLFQCRLNYCRSRKPVLDTINEEPVRSRRLLKPSYVSQFL